VLENAEYDVEMYDILTSGQLSIWGNIISTTAVVVPVCN
jgi:hypothetical protein